MNRGCEARRHCKEERHDNQIERREVSAGILAAAAGIAPRMARAAEGEKTIALMFDAFDSDFWITGNNILKAKAKENGWTTLETISNAIRISRTIK